jgi:hydrogenase maturation protease
VIGVGNDRRGDDAAGLEVVRRLPPVDSVRIIECADDPLGIIDAWEGADDAIVVDAVRSGAPPGTVHVLDGLQPGGLTPRLHGSTSTHAFGVGEAIELARTLGRLPERVRIYGIEGESFVIGSVLSPAVARAVERLAGGA